TARPSLDAVREPPGRKLKVRGSLAVQLPKGTTMPQSLDRLKESPSQTAGPYVHIGLTPNFSGIEGVYPGDLGTRMVNDKTRGERITLRGRVFDGTGTVLKDALIEIWQADAAGLYISPSET